MDCERTEALIWAEIDGEIDAATASDLASHLEACTRCRALCEECRSQEAELRRAFGRRNHAAGILTERLAATFDAQAVRRAPVVRPLPMVAALFVGFALGWIVLSSIRQGAPDSERENKKIADAPQAAPARLEYATGLIQTRADGAGHWTAAQPGDALRAGMQVRCSADALCEILGSDGSVVRMDRGSQVRLVTSRSWELERGRVASTVARGETPFAVRTARATVTALGTWFDVSRLDAEVRLHVFEGATRVESGAGVRVVRRGERAAIAAGIEIARLDEPQLALAASWTNALLALEERGDAELERRLDTLLAGVGESKMDLLLEREIRALGTSCVVPLLRYLQSPRSREHARRRTTAAGIVADLATRDAIDELIELLADENGSVRAAAARGLERLTGRNQGLPAEQWSGDWTECEPAYLRWVQWASERDEG